LEDFRCIIVNNFAAMSRIMKMPRKTGNCLNIALTLLLLPALTIVFFSSASGEVLPNAARQHAVSSSNEIGAQPSGSEKTDTGKVLICEYCKETIRGKYLEIDGKYYHPIHFQCEHCRNPMVDSKYYKRDGKYYCEKCYKELFTPRCAWCGGMAEKNYIVYDGKIYHDSCYYDNVAPRCAISGEPIKGQYLQDFWGNLYKKEYEDKFERCIYCGRFIADKVTGGGCKYNDGRYICNLCHETAVKEQGPAVSLLREVKDRLAEDGIVIDYDDIKLHLVLKDQLKQVSNNPVENELGFVEYQYSTYENVLVMNSLNVYILCGLPRMHYISTAAHELMHIWQYLHGVLDNDLVYNEGSCNYASYLVLQKYPGKEAEYLLRSLEQDEDSIYGGGFRRVKKLVADRGIGYWLDYLKNNRAFPAGY
jgi:hypothetical protein